MISGAEVIWGVRVLCDVQLLGIELRLPGHANAVTSGPLKSGRGRVPDATVELQFPAEVIPADLETADLVCHRSWQIFLDQVLDQ